MRVNVGCDFNALHLGPVLRITENLLGRYYARLDDVLLVIDVMDEHVERLHPLRQASLQLRPFGRRNNARDDVKRDQAFGAGVVAIDGEGNADAAKDQIGFHSLARYGLCWLRT